MKSFETLFSKILQSIHNKFILPKIQLILTHQIENPTTTLTIVSTYFDSYCQAFKLSERHRSYIFSNSSLINNLNQATDFDIHSLIDKIQNSTECNKKGCGGARDAVTCCKSRQI